MKQKPQVITFEIREFKSSGETVRQGVAVVPAGVPLVKPAPKKS